MIGPQKNTKPTEAAPVTVQVGMEYFYSEERKGLDWDKFWEFKGGRGGCD